MLVENTDMNGHYFQTLGRLLGRNALGYQWEMSQRGVRQ